MSTMKAKEKKERPRRAKYQTPEELKAKVDEYFIQCRGKEVLDPRTGRIKATWATPPTMGRLSFFLGFRTRDVFRRQAFRNEQFAEVVAYAKMCCEMYAEERLFDKSGYNGAAFILRYSYGWDRQDVDPERNTRSRNRLRELLTVFT